MSLCVVKRIELQLFKEPNVGILMKVVSVSTEKTVVFCIYVRVLFQQLAVIMNVILTTLIYVVFYHVLKKNVFSRMRIVVHQKDIAPVMPIDRKILFWFRRRHQKLIWTGVTNSQTSRLHLLRTCVASLANNPTRTSTYSEPSVCCAFSVGRNVFPGFATSALSIFLSPTKDNVPEPPDSVSNPRTPPLLSTLTTPTGEGTIYSVSAAIPVLNKFEPLVGVGNPDDIPAHQRN